jgi:TolA-binding protein
MSVVDLHPEELLDKDERDELTADERARLDAHLDRCAACRAEVVLRADFAAELDGEDRPSALVDLVQGALAAPRPMTAPPPAMPAAAAPRASAPSVPTAPTAPAVPTAPTAPAPMMSAPEPIAGDEDAELDGPDAIPGLRRRPRRTAFVLLVAAAVMAAASAGATGLTGRIWLGLRGNSQEVTFAGGSATSSKATPANGAGTALPSGALAGTSVPDPVEPPVVATEEAAPMAAPPVAAVAVAVTLTSARTTPAPVAPAAVTIAPAAVTPAPMPSTASALFDSANAARRDGDTASALARYDALERQFPQTAEARVAKATTGKLLLDRGDAGGALSRFDAYLASGSTELREEAMAGRATALERLGRSDDEVRAWAALLAAYPGTPYAVHAKTRVGRSLGR